MAKEHLLYRPLPSFGRVLKKRPEDRAGWRRFVSANTLAEWITAREVESKATERDKSAGAPARLAATAARVVRIWNFMAPPQGDADRRA